VRIEAIVFDFDGLTSAADLTLQAALGALALTSRP
jgi:hypothetical protein